MTSPDGPELPEELLPEVLASRLRRLHEPPFRVPGEVDERILAAASEHLNARDSLVQPVRRSGRDRWKVAVAMTTTTAMLLFAVTYVNRSDPPAHERSLADVAAESGVVSAGLADDVDGDGRVDILDAFALARAVQSGPPTSLKQDRNHDGAVTEADVKILAGSIVML